MYCNRNIIHSLRYHFHNPNVIHKLIQYSTSSSCLSNNSSVSSFTSTSSSSSCHHHHHHHHDNDDDDDKTITNRTQYHALVLAGCTGMGKSALAMRLARHLNGEIIAADSVSVYKYLNIGSNKPPKHWTSEIRHHLLDVLDPALSLSNPYSAGEFARAARACIIDVCARGRVPIITGGTGMYLGFLQRGADLIRSTDQDSLNVIKSSFEDGVNWKDGLRRISQSLSPSDSNRAAEIECYLNASQTNSVRHLGRAVQRIRDLEPHDNIPIYDGRQLETCNDTILAPINTSNASIINNINTESAIHSPSSTSICYRNVFLCPSSREWLWPRLDWRCETILQRGLLDEVSNLLSLGRLPSGSAPSRSIGYRHAIEYLKDTEWIDPTTRSIDVAKFRVFIDTFQAATRQFAKRQITWFRHEPSYHFEVVSPSSASDKSDPAEIDSLDSVFERVLEHWQRPQSEHNDMINSLNYIATQKKLREPLDASDCRIQARYMPQRRIFSNGMNGDTMMRLMAQHHH